MTTVTPLIDLHIGAASALVGEVNFS